MSLTTTQIVSSSDGSGESNGGGSNNHIITLLIMEQMDCVNEVMKFLCDSDLYYMMFYLSLSRHSNNNNEYQNGEQQINDILDHFGTEKINKRMQIYKAAASQLAATGKTHVAAGEKSQPWITDSNSYGKLVELYNALGNVSGSFSEKSVQEKKECILSCTKSATGYSFTNKQGSMFHLFRELVCLEKQLFESSLACYGNRSLYRTGTIAKEGIQELHIGISGLEKSGKTCMIYSYCTNVFYDNSTEPPEETYPESVNVMMDGNVLCCSFSLLEPYSPTRTSTISPLPFHAIAFTCPATKMENITQQADSSSLYDSEIVKPLRKLIMTFPLTPILIVITQMDLVDSIHDKKTTLQQKLSGFPHLVAIESCSSLTQEGLKKSFDNMYVAAFACKYQTCKKSSDKCLVQ